MTERLPLALVYAPKHSGRALQQDAVASLARSIERLGLRTPITVRATTRIRDGRAADAWEIVAGRHRVEAARSLGWTEIDALVIEGSEDDARLWEIAENLHRADLTVSERAENIAEWIRITGEKAVSAQLAPKLSARGRSGEGRPESGINAAVRDLGIDRTEAQRAVKIASITPEAKEAARAAGLDDNQTVLLAVAKEAEPAAQVAHIEAEGWDGPSYPLCRNTSAVCASFEVARRRATLSFAHHAEVAALPPPMPTRCWIGPRRQ